MPSETYKFLEKLSQGDNSEINRYNYPDELISNVQESSKNPRLTKITIQFEDVEKYLNLLGVDNEEDLWVWRKFSDRYYYEDYSWDRYRDDFFEGYILESLNAENLRLILKIRSLCPVPKTRGEDPQHKLENFLNERFYNEVDNIIDIYQTYHDECIARAVNEIIENETKNPFQKLGITEIYKNRQFKTTVGILLNLYKIINDQELDLFGLLKKLDEKYNKYIVRGDWYELEYNSWCDDFDSNSMNDEIKKYLNDIIEQLEEESEDDEDLIEFYKLFEAVWKLGGFERWINMAGKQITIRFTDLKRNPTRLTFRYRKPNQNYMESEIRSVKNLEELNMMLYQGDLFENVKKILRKLL